MHDDSGRKPAAYTSVFVASFVFFKSVLFTSNVAVLPSLGISIMMMSAWVPLLRAALKVGLPGVCTAARGHGKSQKTRSLL